MEDVLQLPGGAVALDLVRELTEDDLPRLAAGPALPSKVPEIKKLRERHHMLARALASGLSNSQAAAMTGYDPYRLAILRNDPSMKELVAHYRAEVDEKYLDMHARLACLGADVIAEIQDRLEDDPEKFDMPTLMELLKTTADRSGFGPQAKSSVSVNVNVGLATRLEEARRRAREASQPIVEAEVLDA